MPGNELPVLIVLVVASAVVLATGEVEDVVALRDGRSLTAGDQDGGRQPATSVRRPRDVSYGLVADAGVRSWTVRRGEGPSTGDASSTTASRLTAAQWRSRERNKQTRLFMIQRQVMATLGLKRRPNAPRRRDRNSTDAEIERLLPLLQQGDDSLNSTTASLYVVKRVHALLPTCQLQRQQRPRQLCSTGLIPASQAEQSLDAANGTSNDDISRSQAARSGQRSRSSSRPMKLYFNTAELTDGIRRSLVHVKSAVLRLHWTGNTPSHRRSRDRRRDVTGQQETRRRRRPGNGAASRTWNNGTSASTLRLLVYQLTTSATGSVNRPRGGRRLVKSMQLRASDEPRWLSVDVKAAVERWLRKPRRQLGLQLVVRDAAGGARRRNYDSLSVLDGHDCCDVAENSLADGTGHVTDRKDAATATSPTLDVIVLQRSRRRHDGVVAGNHRRRPRRRRRPGRRRGSRDRRDVTGRSRACAMGTMAVSFAELGWQHVIVQPRLFVTGYCYGNCLTPDDSASHDEQDYANRSHGGGCAPSELRPLRVLRMNEQGELSLAVLPDMVVTRCHCLA